MQKNVSNSNVKKYDPNTKEKNQKIAKFFESVSSAGDNNIWKLKILIFTINSINFRLIVQINNKFYNK